jgi:hypothetical protein
MRAEFFLRTEAQDIAPASAKFYRAAVIHRSSGLQPWVNGTKRDALKGPPTPRMRGAIPTVRNTPVLQNSITPLTRIRGRRRRRGRERSASGVAFEVLSSEVGIGAVDGARCAHDRWSERVKAPNPPLGCHLQGESSELRNPGLKPWAVLFTPFGGKPTYETTSDR